MTTNYKDNAGYSHSSYMGAVNANTERAASDDAHRRTMAAHNQAMMENAWSIHNDGHDIFWHREYGLCTRLCKCLFNGLEVCFCALFSCCCKSGEKDHYLSEKLLQETAVSDVRVAAVLEWEKMYNKVGQYSAEAKMHSFLEKYYNPGYVSTSQMDYGTIAQRTAARKRYEKTDLTNLYLAARKAGYCIGPLRVLQAAPSFVEYTYPFYSRHGAAPSLYFRVVAYFDEQGRFLEVSTHYRTLADGPYIERMEDVSSRE
jgi:hypothetical protein